MNKRLKKPLHQKQTLFPQHHGCRLARIVRRLKNYGRQTRYSTKSPMDQLIATILSQRTNYADEMQAFNQMRARFPTWEEVAAAPVAELEALIQPSRFPELKAPHPGGDPANHGRSRRYGTKISERYDDRGGTGLPYVAAEWVTKHPRLCCCFHCAVRYCRWIRTCTGCLRGRVFCPPKPRRRKRILCCFPCCRKTGRVAQFSQTAVSSRATGVYVQLSTLPGLHFERYLCLL